MTGVRFDVLDVDGPTGVQALRQLAACDLAPPGPVVRTGGGGWHYYLPRPAAATPSPSGA